MFDRFLKKSHIRQHLANRLMPVSKRIHLDERLVRPCKGEDPFILVPPHTVENYHGFVRSVAELVNTMAYTGANRLVIYLDRFDPLSDAVRGWLEWNTIAEDTWHDTRFTEVSVRKKEHG